jgi:aspartate 1-decarboxylase
MFLTMLHSKIHRARVTHSELHYEGSLGIDEDLIDQVGMLVGQQIDVLNVNNGARITTYVIKEPRGSKNISIYGAAAHLFKVGDIAIIIAYARMDEQEARTHKPKKVTLGEKNEVIKHG